MKVIMYHYVRKSIKNLPYFRYLDIENFKKQLDYFEKEFGFVKFEDFLELKQNPKLITRLKDKILLSFDDALIDHFYFVLPELLRRKIFGLFFIPTSIYERKKPLDVHRVHYLIGKYGGGGVDKFSLKVYK